MYGKERLPNYVAWGAAGLVMLFTADLIAVPLLAPVATSAVGMYTSWLHGYEPGCTAQTVSQAVSPSGRLTVRIRRGNCADLDPGRGPKALPALLFHHVKQLCCLLGIFALDRASARRVVSEIEAADLCIEAEGPARTGCDTVPLNFACR